jgi:hypothetical protein
VVGDLGRPQQRVQRHHDQPGLEDAEVGEQELRQVRQLHGDLVAALEAEPSRLVASRPEISSTCA